MRNEEKNKWKQKSSNLPLGIKAKVGLAVKVGAVALGFHVWGIDFIWVVFEKYGKLFSGNISLHPDRNRNYRSLQTDPEAYASSGLDVFPESLRSHRRCLHPSDHWCQSLWDF